MSLFSKCWIIFLFAIGVNSFVFANEQGKQIYAACIACHGQNAEGNAQLNGPVLAGQYDWYLTRQLENFSSGLRGTHEQDINGKTMSIFAKSITGKDQFQALSSYINTLPLVSVKGDISGDMMNGSRYYQAKCGACHGGKGEGNKVFNAPKLAGQNPEYLALQMQNFKQGIRGSHKDDKLGRQMAMMARVVSDTELADILFYIAEQE